MNSETILAWLIRATPARPWSLARSTGMTIAAIAIAFLGRTLLDPLLGDSSPFGLFLLAIIVIGYFCGGLFATAAAAVSVVLCIFFFISPRHSFETATDQTMPIAVFLFLAVVLTAAAALLRAAVSTLAARQHELEVSNERSRQIADLSPQIVWSAQPNGVPDYYNSRWYEYSGADPKTAPRDWAPFVHEEDVEAVAASWAQSLKTGDAYEIEMRLRGRDGEYRWFVARALPLRSNSGAVTRWFGSCTDIHDRRMALAMMETLSHELSHRIKNIFAVVTSLIALSVRNEPAAAPFAGQLRKRIDALGRAHDFARPHSDASRPSAPEPTIFALVRILMEPYAADVDDRLIVEGDDIHIADRVATPVALIIHELATNASKYGALSTAEGKVLINGRRVGENYELSWREQGGPPVAAPQGALGFGSRLLDVSAGGQLGGEVERSWEPDGVHVVIRVPLASIERVADSPV